MYFLGVFIVIAVLFIPNQKFIHLAMLSYVGAIMMGISSAGGNPVIFIIGMVFVGFYLYNAQVKVENKATDLYLLTAIPFIITGLGFSASNSAVTSIHVIAICVCYIAILLVFYSSSKEANNGIELKN